MSFFQRPSALPCRRQSFRISDDSTSTAAPKVEPARKRSISMRLRGNKDRVATPAPHEPRRRSTLDTVGQESRSSPPKLTPCNSLSSASTVGSTEHHPPEHVHAQQPSKKPLERRMSGVFKLFHHSHHQRGKLQEKDNDHPFVEQKIPPSSSLSPPKKRSLEKHYGPSSSVIGLGTHAEVVTVQKAGVVYAVKRLRKQRRGESTPDYKKKLYAEFVISSTLHHENIIDTMDIIPDERDHLCVVMEYCGGGDLITLIEATSAQPNLGEINCFFKQLVNGVAYMHSMGIAHRDIKPENLLVSSDGTILKIADFGLAEVFLPTGAIEPQLSRGLSGSDPYISPEEFTASEKGYDASKVDVWAVGITLYAMMFDSLPWHKALAEDARYNVYLRVTESTKGSHSSFPEEQQQRSYSGYLPFDQIKDVKQRDMIYEILNPNPHRRPTAAQLQQHAWFGDLEVCHPGQPCKGHVHSLAGKHLE